MSAGDQKYLESFEMWCWRRMEKINWTDHVRNEEVLLRVNEQRNILHDRGEFRPRQTRQLPRAVDLKGRLLSCQSY